MTKERHNGTSGDTIRLRLVTINANNFKNVNSASKVEIYYLDSNACTESNPDGRTLIETVTDITRESEGMYYIDLVTSSPTYVIGRYLDIWTVQFGSNDEPTTVTNGFELAPELWYTNTTPVVYDFEYHFQPNRIRAGSIKWLIAKIRPNVPRASDLERYYCNIATAGKLYISIEKVCGPCTPQEEDLRLVVDRAEMDIRDRLDAYYKLDTTDMDCGIYNVFFELEYMECLDVSPKMNLQIY